jgi:hypothetical protein
LSPHFSSSVLPSSAALGPLWRQHRSFGVAVICSFHQAVPGGLQVVVPIRNIWRRGTDSRWTWDLKLKRENQIRIRILPPNNASKLMRRSRSALQRAVMSRGSCSRYRMQRRNWWLVLCSGVASYSSAEESERMYSGTSSVPRISSGSKSRLRAKEGEPWDCNQEQEKGLRRKRLLSNGSLLWWGTVLLDWLFSLVRHGLWGFFSGGGGREDVKWWKCMRMDLQSTKGAIY